MVDHVTKHHRPLDDQRAPLLRNGEANSAGLPRACLPAWCAGCLVCLPSLAMATDRSHLTESTALRSRTSTQHLPRLYPPPTHPPARPSVYHAPGPSSALAPARMRRTPPARYMATYMFEPSVTRTGYRWAPPDKLLARTCTHACTRTHMHAHAPSRLPIHQPATRRRPRRPRARRSASPLLGRRRGLSRRRAWVGPPRHH